jgi:hypothetical protein
MLKTDVLAGEVTKDVVHERYKDLALVERGFRTMKTGLLETRPVYVRKEARTRGHVLVVMLAYCLTRELSRLWSSLDVTVEEGLRELEAIGNVEVRIKGVGYPMVMKPGPLARALLKAADVSLPVVVPVGGAKVDTKKKLPKERKQP